MPSYLVKTPLNHDCNLFEPDSIVEMDEGQALPLQEMGILEVQPQAPTDKGKQSVQELIAAINLAETPEAVTQILGDDIRITVIKAADARKVELAKG